MKIISNEYRDSTYFQERAEIVFFVLGADSKSTGAAQWFCGNSNPNIMNVAATRAKRVHTCGDEKCTRLYR